MPIRKTKDAVYVKTISELNGSSKKFFDTLCYILLDEEIALGYLGTFEMIHENYNQETKNKIQGLLQLIAGLREANDGLKKENADLLKNNKHLQYLIDNSKPPEDFSE